MAAEFKAGERLLAYHGALIYRAKVGVARARAAVAWALCGE